MTTSLTALVLLLCLLLWLQHRRNQHHLERLARALGKRDRDALGPTHSKRAPVAVRELERQIREQFFRVDKLKDRIEHREQLLSSVVEGLRDAVLVFDGKMVLRFANSRASQLFDWGEPPQGQRAVDCLRNPKLLEMLVSCVETNREVRASVRYRIPDGDRSELILDADAAPLRINKAGSVARARLVLSDRTAAHEIEQVRKDFVANASHELRTPLTIINGYLENLLEMSVSDEETTRRFLGVMQKHGERIARIVEDMLTISKLESTEEPLQLKRFNLRACAKEVVARLNPLIERKRASVTLDFPEDSHIAGDAFYWDQILFNLVENALKENDAPGLAVRIALERGEDADTVSVSDDGVGIPRAAQAFIFKRFYRVDSSRDAEKKGTGLGLSIVKRAVEAHGGSIRVESTPGQRTAFLMELPRTAEDAAEPEAPQGSCKIF